MGPLGIVAIQNNNNNGKELSWLTILVVTKNILSGLAASIIASNKTRVMAQNCVPISQLLPASSVPGEWVKLNAGISSPLLRSDRSRQHFGVSL